MITFSILYGGIGFAQNPGEAIWDLLQKNGALAVRAQFALWARAYAETDARPNEYIEMSVTTRASLADAELQRQMLNENQLSSMYFIVNAGISEAKRLPIGVYARKSRRNGLLEYTQYVKDEDINRFNAFFVEGDHKSIDEQLAELERCRGLTILVTTRQGKLWTASAWR